MKDNMQTTRENKIINYIYSDLKNGLTLSESIKNVSEYLFYTESFVFNVFQAHCNKA